MPQLRQPRSERDAVVMLAAAFAVLTLISSLQLLVARSAAHESGTLFQVFAMGSVTWMLWALFAPGILWLGRRYDFRLGRRGSSAVVHILGLLACHIPSSLLVTWTGFTLFSNGEPLTWTTYRQTVLLGSRFQFSVVIYAAILGAGYAMRIWLALREREMQTSRLEAQAARARLEALALRLQPHFLFNTLHAIGALIDEDPRLARTMLVQLGDLLRDVLAEPGEVEVPLREEIALLKRYLDIEQLRFADRLRVQVVIEPAALQLLVPRLLLQPLVENALRHGLAPRAEGGQLNLRGAVRDGRLTLRVWNDGAPLAGTIREGIGLATTRERLFTRHGADARFALRAAAEGGVEAIVELPALAAMP